MNKKIFAGLIILMGISILGIIAVQLVWMNNAIRVKNEIFDRGVYEAMQRTVDRLEDIHNFKVVNEMVFDDSVSWVHQFDKNFDFDEDLKIHSLNNIKNPDEIDSINKSRQPIRLIREFDSKNGNTVIEIKVEGDNNKKNSVNTFSYQISTDTDEDAVIIDNKNRNANDILIVKSDTIYTNADSLYSVGLEKIDSILIRLDTFSIVQPDISKRVRFKAGRLKNMASKAVNEIYTWDVKEIDEELLHKVLKEELINNDIPIEFEYGIVRDSTIEFPLPVTDSIKIANTNFRVNLYPNDIFQKNIKLAVFFPSQNSFVYRSLNWLLLASFLFSLFILVTFSLSIYYILRQKKISEMKSDFINNMTHEFKTPIATISVATDSITNAKVVGDPERIKYFAGMIKKENTRMNRQVEDILTIARLDRKDFEFNWEAVNVHDLINDAVQGIILQIEKRGGIIETNFSAANPVVTTDKMHCTNIVYNLIDNANKYSANAPDIKITTINLQKGILISVADKGIGMSKNVQSKIFERFYRQTSGNIHNVKGFGLGLSYVKAVLEANLGTITVQSEPEKGSKFDVFLPFVRE